MEPCYKAQTTLQFRSAGQKFFGIVTDTTGTQMKHEMKGVVPVHQEWLYVFSGDKYTPQGATR